MSTTTYNNFLIQLSSELDTITRTVVFDGYGALSSALAAPLASMIVLYIVLKGYAVARGLIEQPQQELFRFSIRVSLIYLFAMNWDFFSSHVCDLFIGGSEAIATKLMLAIHKQSSGNSINQGLQNVLDEISMLGCDLFEAGSLRKLTPYFAGMMVFLSGSVTVGLAFIELVIAKLMMSVLLCTAPFFILFTLFEQTKSFFERWLGVLAGFSFVLILVSSVVGLSVHLMHWITSSFTSAENPVTAAIWIPIFIVACLCVMGVFQVVNIGKSIGGSVCTSTGAAMLGGFIASSLTAGRRTHKAVNHTGKGVRSGTSSILKGGQQTTRAATHLFKQLHKNLRRGVS
ncbi:MAG: type IV secretion system protein [Legionella sp.]